MNEDYAELKEAVVGVRDRLGRADEQLLLDVLDAVALHSDPDDARRSIEAALDQAVARQHEAAMSRNDD